jgi:hypothetical protein
MISLDFELPSDEIDHYTFASTVSLFDYDVAFWNPANSLQSYAAYSHTYQGRDSLSEHTSASLKRDVQRRRNEFLEFLKLGRKLVVFLPGDTKVFIDTGEKTYSGTGRNRATTRIVTEFDIMQALPTLALTRQAGSGLEISAASDVIAPLLRATPDAWAYRCVLESHQQLQPLAYLKGTNKLVAGFIREKSSGGLILLLPDFFPVEPLHEDEEGEEPEHPGELDPARTEALIGWLGGLDQEESVPSPPWAEALRFPTEAARQEKLNDLEAAIGGLEEKRDSLRAEEAAEAQWKALVYGWGETLERQVQQAFQLFGFTVAKSEPGRSDLRASLGEAFVVAEIKGLAKSAAEKNAAQLEKWVSTEAAEGRLAKGVLVVNGWRDLPLLERLEPIFPHQMLQYCEQREHCLVTGLQLLAMVRACLEDPSRAEEAARVLLERIGRVEGWDDVASIFAQTVDEDVAVAASPAPTSEGATIDASSPDGALS